MSTTTQIEAQVLPMDEKDPVLFLLARGATEGMEVRIGNVSVTVETVALLRVIQLIREAQR